MNNVYELLNSAHIDLDEYTYCELSELEKKQMKTNFKTSVKTFKRHKKSKTAIIAAIILTVAIFGVSLIDSNVYANIFGISIEQFFGYKTGLLQDYKTAVEQTVTNQGVAATLNEFVLDNSQVLITTTFNSDKVKWNGQASMVMPSAIYINGKDILANSWTGVSKAEQIDDSTYSFLNSVNFDSTKLKGNIHIKIVFNKLENVKGNWTFEFTSNRDNLTQNTKVIPINKIVTLDNGLTGTIDALTLSSMSTSLNFKIPTTNGKYGLAFIVRDQDGKEIQMISGSQSVDKGTWIYNGLDKTTTKLTITPISQTYNTPKTSGEETTSRKVLDDQTFEVRIK
jgi:hypothetical protein